MSQNIVFDRESAWGELLERARSQGITTAEAFHEMVDDYFNELLQVGELDEDQNIAELAAEYKERWEDFQKDLGIG